MSARLATMLIAGLAAASFHALEAAAAPHYEDIVISDKKLGKAQATFKTTTPAIYLHAKLVDTGSASTVRSDWIAEKTQVAAPNYKVDSVELKLGPKANAVDFSMSKPNKGWPPGDYRVDLFIDGKPAGKVKFQVK